MIVSIRSIAASSSPRSPGIAATRCSNPACQPSGPKSDRPVRRRARSRRSSGVETMGARPVLVSGHIGRQQPSLFAAPTRVPSSALIEKALRDITDTPGTDLDEHTVDVLCDKLRESARLLSEFALTANPVDRAESFRYLLTMVAYAVDAALLNADPLEPLFSQPYRLHLL